MTQVESHLNCRGTHRLLEAALASTADGAAESQPLRGGHASPLYVDFKDQIGAEMAVIDKKMTELRQLHGRAALTSFDDTNSSEVEIEIVTQEITRLFRKCEVRLQKFGSGVSASETDEKVPGNLAFFRQEIVTKHVTVHAGKLKNGTNQSGLQKLSGGCSGLHLFLWTPY